MTLGHAHERRAHPRPPRTDVWKMFDRVAQRYDFLNRLLSAGIDPSWRKRMASLLPPGRDLNVLDLATGTADQLLLLFEKSDGVKSGVGIDLAEKMLDIGRKKIEKLGLAEAISLQVGDAMEIPAGDNQFDVVTISFGIRNMTNVRGVLEEMYRVLKPGGRVLVLEFSLPNNGLIRPAYLFYLRHILPLAGGLLSGEPHAYRYLNETIETFPYGEAFCGLLEDAGFEAVAAHPITFRIATIYQGDKPEGQTRHKLVSDQEAPKSLKCRTRIGRD